MLLARLDWLSKIGVDPLIMATWVKDWGKVPGIWAGDIPGGAMPKVLPIDSPPCPGEGAGAMS